jgi:hypothetical protein
MPNGILAPMNREIVCPPRKYAPPTARAIDHVRVIRETMDRCTRFTAIPGVGAVLVGLTAFPTVAMAHDFHDGRRWLATWLCGALTAYLVGAVAVYARARRENVSIRSRPARQFLIAFGTPHLLAAILTVAAAREGLYHLLPSIWLGLYGIGAITAGLFSHRYVSWLGTAFLLISAAATLYPKHAGNLWMVLGFGVAHVVFGVAMAREKRRGA